LKKDKLKKGGLDTIIAYIVVSLPLFYVLIYMVATIYHFSVQMYLSQVVKEATVMASTYGAITPQHEQYIKDKLKDVLGQDDEGETKVVIEYYVKEFIEEGEEKNSEEIAGTVRPIAGPFTDIPTVGKADIIGISVESKEASMLGNVSAFNMFGTGSEEAKLKYSAYREEIIRNERPI